MSENLPDILRELPPSCILVFRIIDERGPCTQATICEESLLAARTVRDALGRLEQHDLITERPCPDDGRQSLYERTTDGE